MPRGQERAYRPPGTNPLTTGPYLVSILIAQTCEGTLAPYTSCVTKHSALPSGTTSVAANRHPRTWCAAQNVQYCNSYYVVSTPPPPFTGGRGDGHVGGRDGHRLRHAQEQRQATLGVFRSPRRSGGRSRGVNSRPQDWLAHDPCRVWRRRSG